MAKGNETNYTVLTNAYIKEQAIVLVGGFGSCKYLFNLLKVEHQDIGELRCTNQVELNRTWLSHI